MILIFLIKLNYLHFSISLGHTHGGGSWHILAQSWPKFHTPGSLWVPETLPRMAIVVPSLHHSLLCHFRHGAVPGMHILFLSGFFLMRSYSFVLSSVTIVKGKLASISTWVTLVDQFATAVDAWVGRICVLAPLPLLLFSLVAYPAKLSCPSCQQYNTFSRWPTTSMFPSPMASSQPSSYLTHQQHLTQLIVFPPGSAFFTSLPGYHTRGSSLVPFAGSSSPSWSLKLGLAQNSTCRHFSLYTHYLSNLTHSRGFIFI